MFIAGEVLKVVDQGGFMLWYIKDRNTIRRSGYMYFETNVCGSYSSVNL